VKRRWHRFIIDNEFKIYEKTQENIKKSRNVYQVPSMFNRRLKYTLFSAVSPS